MLFEVLSPATRDYDQGDKFAHYRSIETLAHYVLVDPDARLVEHRSKVADDQWLATFARAGEVHLASIGISVALDALWKDLDRLARGG